MTPSRASSDRSDATGATARRIELVWVVAGVALALWSAVRLGTFDLSATVPAWSGGDVTVPETFATVDHPFHVARTETLRASIAGGDLLRWVGNHQGGYPVEFYPLGIPWATLAVWALSAGTLSIASAYKLLVVAIFVAPLPLFMIAARLDRLALGAGVLAFAAHLAIPGAWWSGGYTELVLWGLVTNVAAYVLAFAFLLVLAIAARSGARWALALSALLAAATVATNTRAAVALGCAALGILLAEAFARSGYGQGLRAAAYRVTVVAAVAILLTAPLLVSLLRFQDLYTFVQYEWYDSYRDYLNSSVDAVGWPVLVLAAIGTVVALRVDRFPLARALAWTLLLYVLATVVLGGIGRSAGLVEQLEPTRLMPFQRLLMLSLAGFAVAAAPVLVPLPRASRRAFAHIVCGLGVAALVFVAVRPPSDLPVEERTMFPVQTTAATEFDRFLDAVELADEVAPASSAVYVAGSSLSWHEQLWAPFETDRPLYYDNWLWLWHPWHEAPGYVSDIGHAYVGETIPATFRRDYLELHGIGAVVAVTSAMYDLAEASPDLEPAGDPALGVFLVRDTGATVSYDAGDTTSVDIASDTITATVAGDGGELLVRQTWFPRWEAESGGEPLPIERGPGGYMTVTLPPGEHEVVFTYGTDAWDWVARALSLLGAGKLAGVVFAPRTWVERLTGRPSTTRPRR